jgi:hypothetical protein
MVAREDLSEHAPPGGSVTGQELSQNRPHPFGGYVPLEQHLCCEALSFSDESEQDVLRADVVVPQMLRFPLGQLESFLRSRGERDLADHRGAPLLATVSSGREGPLERAFTERLFDPPADLVHVDPDSPKRRAVFLIDPRGRAGSDRANDLGSDVLQTDAEPIKRPVPNARAIPQQSKEQVLGSDVVVMQASRFFLGEDDRSSRALREVLEHGALPSSEATTRVLLVDRLFAHPELLSDRLPRPTEVPRVPDLQSFQLLDQATECRDPSKTNSRITAARLTCHLPGLHHAVNVR